MNLIKNVNGGWDLSKELVRQDLDTIQRTINQILAQINAPVTPTPAPPAVISSANTVTVPTTDFLTTVATLPTGALTGDGTITKPLGVQIDGSTITVNASNKLVAATPAMTVHVDAAGALSGDGSIGSPLAVKVDGSTVTIVGDALVATVPASWGLILKATIGLTTAQVNSLNTVPIQLIAAVSNKIIVPLVVVGTVVTGAAAWTNASTGVLVYGNAINPAITGAFPLAEVFTNKTYVGYATGSVSIVEVDSSVSNYPKGTAVCIKSNGVNSGTPSGNSTTITCYYIVIDP